MIPYNPSSFNTNKTILEQILELKNWLKAHPSYEIFYSSEAGNTSQAITSYDLTAITDPTNMEIGDVVIFHNVTVGVVTSIDRDNNEFGCDSCVSFKGDTGATGPQGPTGSQGISITNVTINASNHLICTLSDGSSIDAGSINFAEEYVEVSSSSGTLLNDDRLKIIRGATLIYVDGNNKYYLEPYKYNNISQSMYYSNTRIESSMNEGGKVRAQIHTITGNYSITIGSSNGKVVLAENIDSQTATNGKVLMANGSGSASWQTPSTPAIEGTSIKSTGVTSGKVLQADGNGGASWQNAGGGSTLYEHRVSFNYQNQQANGFNIVFRFISSSATSQLTNYSNAYSFLIARFSNNTVDVSGKYNKDSSTCLPIYTIYAYNNVITANYIDPSLITSQSFTLTQSMSITEQIRAL